MFFAIDKEKLWKKIHKHIHTLISVCECVCAYERACVDFFLEIEFSDIFTNTRTESPDASL